MHASTKELTIVIAFACCLACTTWALANSSGVADGGGSWIRYNNSDSSSTAFRRVGNCGIYYKLPPCNVTLLKQACLGDIRCTAFNTNGWLKSCGNASCGATIKPTDDTDLYVLKDLPPAPPPSVHPPPIDDWHYPKEEPQQNASLQRPDIQDVSVSAGWVQIAGTKYKPGQETENGWLVLAVFSRNDDDYAALEFNFERWGLMLLQSSDIATRVELRKPVGRLASLQQPVWNLTSFDSAYWKRAYIDPNDYIARRLLAETSGEPTFETAHKYMAPTHDYGLVGTVNASMKYVVTTNSMVKCANTTVFEYDDFRQPSPGLVLFNSSKVVSPFPNATTTSAKSGLVGRYLRVVNVGMLDHTTGAAFETIVAPVHSSSITATPFLVRIRQGNGTSFEYFGQFNQPMNASDFYGALLDDYIYWQVFFSASPTQLRLPAVDRRQADMISATITAATTMYIGLLPNYGFGIDYWSVTIDRGSSLPLTSLALDNALIEWGLKDAAADRIKYYFDNFVEEPGYINMQNWGTCPFTGGGCPLHSFNDGLSDYGQMLDMWVRQATSFPDETQWIEATLPKVEAMARYLLLLRSQAKNATDPHSSVHGLLFGPAEHDTCHTEGWYLSNQVWTWRGLQEFGNWLVLNNQSTAIAAEMLQEASAMIEQIAVAAASSTAYNSTGDAIFVSPLLGNQTVSPFDTMIESTLAEYSNFRYFSETLLASGLSEELDLAIANFRESHTGAVSGITRWSDHLDDMPTAGYGFSDLLYDRLDSFFALHEGHMANYHSPGVFGATEQIGIAGDGKYRAYLGPTGPQVERDVDFCVPSTMLVALFSKWQMVFVPRDKQEVWLCRACPRRWFSDEGFELRNASTPFGPTSLAVSSNSPTSTTAEISFSPFPTVAAPVFKIRLRSQSFDLALQNATVNSWTGMKPKIVHVDATSDTVTVIFSDIPSSGASFALDAHFG